ncbi:hypothetical protein BH11PLA2_BH11PLA2_35300 [soil metagenome]
MRSLLAVLFTAFTVLAAERTHTVVPADYFTLATITEVAVSPDGKHVAYAEARWDKADDQRKGDLWVLATDGKSKPVKLTFDRTNDHKLKWSADSGTIYFLSNRKRAAETKAPYDGKTQVWSIPVTGGSPRAVTSVDGGITGYDLAAKANALVYSTDTKASDDDAFAKLRSTYKLDYGHGIRAVSELHRVNLDDWRTDKLYEGKRYIREFAVTTDGKKVAMITAIDDSVVKSEGESRVDIVTPGEPGASATGVVVTPPTDVYRAKAASPNAWLENLAWNPQGTRFAFNAIFDGYPAALIFGSKMDGKYEMSAMPFYESNQIIGYGRTSGQAIHWIDENVVSYVRERNGLGMFRAYQVGSTVSKPNDPDPVLYGNCYGSSHSERPGGLDTVSIIAANGELARITFTGLDKKPFDPNPHTATWKLPTVKHITWKAPDGSSVGGVLELPPGYDGKSKLPLVVAIHGGPTTSSKAALEFDPHNGRMYFATAGYAVLCPNYRGSTGYGDKFVTDLIGHENDIEVNDIIAGVQHLVKEGIADGDRVGVMGWSNGGYLTNCLITRKDLPFKLKAASSGAGIVDTVAEWGFNDEPAYPKVFKKGHPWETPDIYKATSPTYQLGNIKTPTLIHVGGNDVRCPPGHSRMLYRAMKEYLNVPTELCEYPGEPHGLSKWTHRQAKMDWDLAWFEKYLK